MFSNVINLQSAIDLFAGKAFGCLVIAIVG